MTGPENVVISVEPEEAAAIRYRTLPNACSGAASTLAEARSSYRGALTGLFNVDRHDLPPVIEHVEAKVHGMWVREKVGSVHRDLRGDRMLLQALLASGQEQTELRAHLESAADLGAQPVVVLVEPEDPLASVLDQMAPEDAVVVAYADPEAELGWAAIYGSAAKGAADMPVAVGDDALRAMPIDRFARSVRHGAGMPGARLTEPTLPKAS